jgi:multiple sugar transport system substrate-binding protein
LAASALFNQSGPLAIPALQFVQLARAKPLHPAYPVIREVMADTMDDILAGADFKESLSRAADLIDADIALNNQDPPFDDM